LSERLHEVPLPSPPVVPLGQRADALRRDPDGISEVELPGVVRPADFYRLRFLLRQYVDNAGSAQSVLVEGYRGAGKTTFTRTLIEDVWRAQKRDRRPVEPLPVLLHAPTMRIQELPGDTKGGDDDRTTRLKVLVHLATRLASAVERHFMEAFLARSRVESDVARAELHARLELEMRGAPSPAVLLAFWKSYDAVTTGILTTGAATQVVDDDAAVDDDARTRAGLDQQRSRHRGVDEMLLLWTTLRILRRLTGKDTTSFTNNSGQKASQELVDKRGFDAGKVLQAGLGASVIGAVATALGAESLTTAFAALAGGLTAYNVTATDTITSETDDRWSQSFAVDTSVPSLMRLIPELIGRLRRLGMAPVFVVDELDKLDEKRIQLFSDLKSFINEEAFFFFLDQPRHRADPNAGYDVETTLWNHRVMLAYEPIEVIRALLG
jgi:hypothetical protein